MLINEDYFRDLEISDEDIMKDDDIDVEEPVSMTSDNLEEYINKLQTEYEQCLVFGTYSMTAEQVCNNFSKSLKRIDYILNVFDVEHSEFIFSDIEGHPKVDDIHICNIRDYDIITADKLDIYYKKEYRITTFVNFPKFTYKMAYIFFEKLYKVLFQQLEYSQQVISIMFMLSHTLNLEEILTNMFNIKRLRDMRCCGMTSQQYNITTYDDRNLPFETKYMDFFEDVLRFFFNSKQDIKNINIMRQAIYDRKDPFDELNKQQNR